MNGEELGEKKSIPIKEAVGLYLLEVQEMYAANAAQRFARELSHFCRYVEGAGVAQTRDLRVEEVIDFLNDYYPKERLYEEAGSTRDVLAVTKRWLKWLDRHKYSRVYEEYRSVMGAVKSSYKDAVRQARSVGQRTDTAGAGASEQ